MPIDLEIIEKLSEEQKVAKRHPRTLLQKKKQPQSLIHWAVCVNGKMVGSLKKNRQSCIDYLEENSHLFMNQPTIQRLVCHEKIDCECGLKAVFYTYKGHKITYLCPDQHTIVISEYA